MDPRHALGMRAEAAVAHWLEGQGWRVLATRHRARPNGEIDLVMLDPDEALVAVEVRARRSGRTGGAAESVDGRRVARLQRALAGYAAARNVVHSGLRVDLVTVERLAGPEHERWRLSRIPGVERS